MVERIFCDVCGNEVNVEPNPVWRGLQICPRSADGKDAPVLEVDLCKRCGALTVDEVERFVIGLRKEATQGT